jgi:hypothetical protein
MAEETSRFLKCVADAGGPEADSIIGIYEALSGPMLRASSVEELLEVSMRAAQIIADCAGDYNETRQALLIPIRDRIVEEYAEELAEAEKYFNEMLRLAYEN